MGGQEKKKHKKREKKRRKGCGTECGRSEKAPAVCVPHKSVEKQQTCKIYLVSVCLFPAMARNHSGFSPEVFRYFRVNHHPEHSHRTQTLFTIPTVEAIYPCACSCECMCLPAMCPCKHSTHTRGWAWPSHKLIPERKRMVTTTRIKCFESAQL